MTLSDKVLTRGNGSKGLRSPPVAKKHLKKQSSWMLIFLSLALLFVFRLWFSCIFSRIVF